MVKFSTTFRYAPSYWMETISFLYCDKDTYILFLLSFPPFLLLLEQFCSRCSLRAHLILPYSANCRLLSMSCHPYCFSTISNSSLWWLPSALIHLWFDASRKALIESSFTLFLLNSIFMCLKVNQFLIFCLLYFTICVYTVLILSLLQIHLWQWVSAPGRSQKESV